MSPDREVIFEIATEMAIDPAFVEKDWYSVQVLSAIAALKSEAILTIFSGGTSLLKGFDLLKRFSEDLDFRCCYQLESSGNQKRKARSVYREGIVSAVRRVNNIELSDEEIRVASNYIKFPLAYPRKQFGHDALRSGLQVEFSFTQPRLKPEIRPIQSLVSRFTNSKPETEILCFSPVETGSDKLSALTWRVLKRDRRSETDDPAMIRHLHDLCALRGVLQENKSLFVETAYSSFEEDQKTGKRDTKRSFSNSMKAACEKLKNDKEYEAEYVRFVDAMSYADDDENIDFNAAVENFEVLIDFFN